MESTIHPVVSRWFVKKQPMQWTLKGAHWLLQTRTKILNNELEDLFRTLVPPISPQGSNHQSRAKGRLTAGFVALSLYQQRNKRGHGLDGMKFYREVSKVRHGAPTSECALTKSGEIVVGKFVDRDRPDYIELLRSQMVESLGERFAEPWQAMIDDHAPDPGVLGECRLRFELRASAARV